MVEYDEFLNPICKPNKLEFHTFRSSILFTVKEHVPLFLKVSF